MNSYSYKQHLTGHIRRLWFVIDQSIGRYDDRYSLLFDSTLDRQLVDPHSTVIVDRDQVHKILDCEQSLFFFRFSGSNARARQPLPSCAISHARGHLRFSRFARRTTEKRETARSLTRSQLSDSNSHPFI